MATSGTTTYLRLRTVTPGNTNWYADLEANWNRIDLLGRHLAVQTAPGSAFSLRAQLYDNSLVEAIRVTPDQTGALTIQIGRNGSNDKIVYAGSLAFNTITISNSRPGTFAAYSLKLRAAFDNASDSIVYLDSQQNIETTISFPTDWAHAKPWTGSFPQLELENSTTRNRQCFLTFTVKDGAGTIKQYIVPTYLL